MKPKHHGIVSVIILVVGLGAAGAYFGLGKYEGLSMGKRLPVKKIPEITLPNPAIVKKIGQLERRMGDLANIQKDRSGPVDLTMFGVFRKGQSRFRKEGGEEPVEVVKDYQLSLAFKSIQKRFCIIDGNVYEEGAMIPDGTKVVKIETYRVLIRTYSSEKWIALKSSEKEKEKGKE